MEIVPPTENTAEATRPSGLSAQAITVTTGGGAASPATVADAAAMMAAPPTNDEPAGTATAKARPAARPGPPLKIHEECLLESVGFQFDDDFFFPMLNAGAGLTTFGGRVFVTSVDWQTELTLPVFAGTNSKASRNRPLGVCIISGVPAGPRGKARVEIRFTAAEDGTLAITAHTKDSGRELFVELRAPAE